MRHKLSSIIFAITLTICGVIIIAQPSSFQAHSNDVIDLWSQSNPDGFGVIQNGQIPSLAVFDSYLYAGTQNYATHPERSEIWRTQNGIDWVKVDDRLGSGAAALIAYKGYIYCGSWGDDNGGNIWRSQNGTVWTDVVTDGFGDSDNGIARFAVFEDLLYASTWNSVSGSQIWRSSNGTEWVPFVSSIGNHPHNGGAIASAEFKDYLYWGIDNWTDGAEIWRTDGETLSKIIDQGFGSAENFAVSSLAVFSDYLYAGITNNSNVQIWRTNNGTEWSHIVDADFGNPGTMGINALEVFDHMLYFIIENDSTGLEVWRTTNGTDWEQIGFAGFGDSNNQWSFWDNATTVFQGELFVASRNTVTGGEIWKLMRTYTTYVPLALKQ